MEEQLKQLIKAAVQEAIKEMNLQAPTEIDSHPEIMDAKEAAEYLRLSKGYLIQAIDTLQIPHRRAGTKYLFKKSELNRWMEEKEGISSDIRVGSRKIKII